MQIQQISNDGQEIVLRIIAGSEDFPIFVISSSPQPHPMACLITPKRLKDVVLKKLPQRAYQKL